MAFAAGDVGPEYRNEARRAIGLKWENVNLERAVNNDRSKQNPTAKSIAMNQPTKGARTGSRPTATATICLCGRGAADRQGDRLRRL